MYIPAREEREREREREREEKETRRERERQRKRAGIMHARLSTVCNYEITPDPLYASIIIAFYASTGETTANFSVPRARARKVVLHFPSGCSFPFQLTVKEEKRKRKYIHLCMYLCVYLYACVFIVVKPTSSLMLSLTRRHFSHVMLPRELCIIPCNFVL